MKNLTLSWGVLCVLATAACEDAAAPRPPAASIDLDLSADTLLTGATLQLSVSVTSSEGDPILSGDVTWATSDPSVATVSPAGIVTTLAGGAVAIYAAIDALADSTQLLVVNPLQAVELTVGSNLSCAIIAGGAAFCWGWNFAGALGNGLVEGAFTRPGPISGGMSWRTLAGGDQHACGITSGGSAYCWGYNGVGQLGDNTTTSRVQPTAIQSASPILALAAGFFHTCGLTATGAECWGNLNGFSGMSLATLVSGWDHACGMTAQGAGYCWGSNYQGQLGDGTTDYRIAPVAVAGSLSFDMLDAGSRFTCGIADGSAYCWGENQTGQLGDGTTASRLVPTSVGGGHQFAAITAGSNHACALTSGGAAWCWGSNFSGQLGDGSQIDRLSPVSVAGGRSFTRIAAGGSHTCGIAVSGRVYCWGTNWLGQLGDNSVVDHSVPAEVWAP